MLVNLVELRAIEFRPGPLDAIVERRLETIWAARSYPNCGADSLHATELLTYSMDLTESGVTVVTGKQHTRAEPPSTIRNSPPGEFLIAFVIYADTLLSINQIALLLLPCYTTLYDRIMELETSFCREFPTVWEIRSQTVSGPTQVDETQQVCLGFNGQDPPR